MVNAFKCIQWHETSTYLPNSLRLYHSTGIGNKYNIQGRLMFYERTSTQLINNIIQVDVSPRLIYICLFLCTLHSVSLWWSTSTGYLFIYIITAKIWNGITFLKNKYNKYKMLVIDLRSQTREYGFGTWKHSTIWEKVVPKWSPIIKHIHHLWF